MKYIEKVKIDLSTLKEVTIDIDGIYKDEDLNQQYQEQNMKNYVIVFRINV